MKTTTIVENWKKGLSAEILRDIHQKDINIAIYNRNVNRFEKDANALLKRNIEFKSSGDITTILGEITKVINVDEFHMIIKDIEHLLSLFKEITGVKRFQLLIATINTNMCRRFHTDVNDLRILCTYAGEGTLWLTEDNIDRKALNTYQGNESIVINKDDIKQVETGDVIILKGTAYQNKTTKAIVHRSPTIEKSEKRLLLRIDTEEFIKTC